MDTYCCMESATIHCSESHKALKWNLANPWIGLVVNGTSICHHSGFQPERFEASEEPKTDRHCRTEHELLWRQTVKQMPLCSASELPGGICLATMGNGKVY